MPGSIVILGTLDTKAEEVAYLKARIEALGRTTLVLDIGFGDHPRLEADIDRWRVAEAGGSSIDEISSRLEREEMIEEWAAEIMARGAAKLLRELYDRGAVAGVVGVGGSMGSFMASEAMKALPFGVPKLLVTTQASTPRAPHYVGSKDVVLMNAVSDMIGLNWLTRRVLASAAQAIVGMAGLEEPLKPERPLIGATGIGITPCIMKARELLDELGYELIPFHATGSGGKAFESLIKEGLFIGVLDLALHEIANDVFGGSHKVGPERLTSAGSLGIPQVVAPGALCYTVYVTLDEIPQEYRSRTIWRHNPYAYGVELTKNELIKLSEVIAERLNLARGPTKVLIPLRGWCGTGLTSVEMPKIEDCEAFTESLKQRLKHEIEVELIDAHINDPKFAEEAVQSLIKLIDKR